jgi:hypothetical protein
VCVLAQHGAVHSILNQPAAAAPAAAYTFLSGDFSIEDSKRLCVYSLNTALSKLPEGREQIMGLIDLRGISLSNIDLVFVAFMVDAFFVYYPRR